MDVLLIVDSDNSNSNLRKRKNTHWHLRNEYFIAIIQFVTDIKPNVCGVVLRTRFFLFRIMQINVWPFYHGHCVVCASSIYGF